MGQRALPDLYLTKSNFLDVQQCPAFGWMKKHRPHLIPPVEEPGTARALYFGNQVDQLARDRFPQGMLIKAPTLADSIRETTDLMADPSVTALFQAAVLADPGFVARADVLLRDGVGWQLIEVKGSNSVKTEHVIDAAFQVAAFEAAGIKITRVAILILDREYRLDGLCDPQLLFAEEDRTQAVRDCLPDVLADMKSALGALAADRPPSCPCVGKTKKNRCATFMLFHPEIPQSGSIYELSRISASKIAAALDRGVTMLADWPADLELSYNQRRQLEVHRSGQHCLDVAGLRQLLDQLQFPLYFLDYETSSVPIPMWDGCWPYQQVPFQYSLHVVYEDGSIRHREFLATATDRCPSSDLAASLFSEIGREGSVVVWHSAFERDRNADLAQSAPEFAEFFFDLNVRMLDLEHVVAKGHYLHPEFRGSSSIKVVLPVLAPDLSYAELAIGDGTTASDRWLACALGEITGDERAATFAALREYCHLDTLAMVRIWQCFTEIATREPESSVA